MASNVDEVTHVVQDYLKAIWQAAEWGGAPATTSTLAARFATTPANVSDTLRRLSSLGLVDRMPYRPPTLTDKGRGLALAMVRRHRLIETYLVRALGYACTEVHADAESLEHAVSDVFLERIDELLGFPVVDPHGDPIPSRDGLIVYPEVAESAVAVPAGEYVVVRISDSDPELLVALHEVDIHAGSLILLVDQGGARVVRVVGREESLSGPALACMLVAPRA